MSKKAVAWPQPWKMNPGICALPHPAGTVFEWGIVPMETTYAYLAGVIDICGFIAIAKVGGVHDPRGRLGAQEVAPKKLLRPGIGDSRSTI
jgi:hypothetical protein